MQTKKYNRIKFFTVFILLTINVRAQGKTDYFTVENYYKVKWGYAEEFITLWKTNHYPLLKKAIEKGDIISVEAGEPRLHSGEDTRWDFKVTIVFKDVKAAFASIQVEQKEKVAVFTATIPPGVLKKIWSEAQPEVPAITPSPTPTPKKERRKR